MIAADLAPLLDPVPEASVSEPWVHVVVPGSGLPVSEPRDGQAAPNGGVAVYLYELTARGGRVRFARVQLASAQEIRPAGRSIVIRQLRL